MARTGTDPESSMEEILASIRRIISEDTADPASAAGPAGQPSPPEALPAGLARLSLERAGAPAPGPQGGLEILDEDILDLSLEAREPGHLPAAPAPVAHEAWAPSAAPSAPPIVSPARTWTEPPAPSGNGAAAPRPSPVRPEPAARQPAAPPAAPAPAAAAVVAPLLRPLPPVQPASPPAPQPAVGPVSEWSALDRLPEAGADMNGQPLEDVDPLLAEPEVEVPVLASPSGTAGSISFIEDDHLEAGPAEAPPATGPEAAPADATPPTPAAEASPPPAAAAAAAAAPALPGTARTVEDMVAEMLRPMLKDWLDANMPRIIDKAIADGRLSRG